MSRLNDLLAQTKPPPTATKTLPHDTGMVPNFAYDGNKGHVTTGPVQNPPNEAVWKHLITDWGLDPDTVEIVDGSITVKGWDSPVAGTTTGETIRLLSYTAKIVNKQPAGDDLVRTDIDELCKRAAKMKPARLQPVDIGGVERAMIVPLADWQLGKGEGDGSEGTVARIENATGRLLERLANLRKIGRGVDVVYLVGLGDMIEGCAGHYASQTFTVDLTRREQMKIARLLVKGIVDALVNKGYRVVLTAVAGNHGENRNGAGKAFTTPEDNDDLAVVEQLGEVFAANPDRYHGVSVYLPERLSMAVDVCGVIVGFYHGHMGGKGSFPHAKMVSWWKDQITGRENGRKMPTADALILVTGHYHHLVVNESLGRTHFLCPAMDPGSRWYTESSGQASPAGMLTFCVGGMYGDRGWGDLEVL